MNFTTSVNRLQEIVNKVSLAIPNKVLDPRFENLYLSLDNEILTLSATDGDISITAKTSVNSTDTGNFCMKAHTIQNFLRSMYETDVNIKIEKQQLSEQGVVTIETDKGYFKIPCVFESISEKQEKNYDIEINIPTEDLLSIISRTTYACSLDDMRPSMMGVLFEIKENSLTAVATDGHRLVRLNKSCDISLSEKQKIVIPARVLSILQKLINEKNIKLSIDAKNKNICFLTENFILDAAAIVEQYPNYDAVIPLENDKKLVINKQLFYDSVKRVGRFSSIGDIRLLISSSSVKIEAENINESQSAQEEITGDYTNEPLEIGFNSKFLEDALAHIDEESILIELNDPTTAVILRPEKEKDKEGYINLVMPVRINK